MPGIDNCVRELLSSLLLVLTADEVVAAEVEAPNCPLCGAELGPSSIVNGIFMTQTPLQTARGEL